MRRLLPTLIALFAPVAARADLTFEKDVRPVLKAHCFQCHGEDDKPKAKLDVRLPSLMLKGGRGGPAVVPGKPHESLLIEKVASGEMPEGKKKLTGEQVATLRKWVEQGAKTARPEPKNPADLHITDEERAFWAFQPVRRPAVPEYADGRSPIDAFVAAKLRANGLDFAPDADKLTLIRRATFDLTGLPPTPEEIDSFIADEGSDCYRKLIERLLASPRYGERWGRHWLDAAGYADSDGVTTKDPIRPYAFKYRDYVIRSLNADKPWDAFIREQLAGDEMGGDIEQLAATGFLRTAPDASSSPDIADAMLEHNQTIAESLKVVSTSLLGLSVGCAQCHDHRYDPISQLDYYRFRAVFDPAYDWKNWRKPAARLVNVTPAEVQEQREAVAAEVRVIEAELSKRLGEIHDAHKAKALELVPEPQRVAVRAAVDTPVDKRSKEQLALIKEYPFADVLTRERGLAGFLNDYDLKYGTQFRPEVDAINKRIKDKRAEMPPEEMVAVLNEVPGKVPESRLFARGDHEQPKQVVTPADLPILALHRKSPDIAAKDPSLPTTGRRLAFAKSLTDGSHPLLARVLVNRFWSHHFGRGIVATPGDFGELGDRPTHPELLDWLAADFVANGWTLKRFHRMVMTSRTYRQSSIRSETSNKIDPENRWLGRFPLRRLDAESVRDAMLAANGRLRDTMFGPPASVAETVDGRVVAGKLSVDVRLGDEPIESIGADAYKRSVYVQMRRKWPLAVLDAFDLPVMNPNCEARRSSTVAPQALFFLNNEFAVEQSRAMVARLEREHPGDPQSQLRRGWRLLFGAEPTTQELGRMLLFVHEQSDALKPADAMASLLQSLMASNRFLYVD